MQEKERVNLLREVDSREELKIVFMILISRASRLKCLQSTVKNSSYYKLVFENGFLKEKVRKIGRMKSEFWSVNIKFSYNVKEIFRASNSSLVYPPGHIGLLCYCV